MMMMMLMMDDYYLVFVVTSEYHFRILRQESISNALQHSGGLKQLWAFTGQPHQSRENSSAALSTTRQITKITTVIYYSPPSAAGSTPSLSRVPLRSLSSAIAPSPTPLSLAILPSPPPSRSTFINLPPRPRSRSCPAPTGFYITYIGIIRALPTRALNCTGLIHCVGKEPPRPWSKQSRQKKRSGNKALDANNTRITRG
jgi:hypothetical protein